MQNTYCSRLWEELTIDPDGSVYCCCRNLPGVLGNIYEKSLPRISQSPSLIHYRRMSLSGSLSCRKFCTLMEGEEVGEKRGKLGRYPQRRLLIRMGNLCNISCIMCYCRRQLPMELNLDRVLPNLDLHDIKYVDLTGGEPLFMRGTKRLFDLLVGRGLSVSLMTNGTLLNEEWVEKIVRHSRWVYVSLNASTKQTHEVVNRGSCWETVLRNVDRVRKLKEKLRTKIRIHGHMTVVMDNFTEVSSFIKKAPSFGFEELSIGFCFAIRSFLQNNPDLVKEERERVEIVMKDKPSDFYVGRQNLILLGLLGDGS